MRMLNRYIGAGLEKEPILPKAIYFIDREQDYEDLSFILGSLWTKPSIFGIWLNKVSLDDLDKDWDHSFRLPGVYVVMSDGSYKEILKR